jgi:nucleoside phosphorylase
LATRETLYQHDIKRYPFYFDSDLIKKLSTVKPGHGTQRGATRRLETFFLDWLERPSGEIPSDLTKVTKIVTGALRGRDGKAITKTLFRTGAGSDVSSLAFLQRSISREYTRHYMAECDADILTGLPGLGPYDDVALSFPFNDVRLLGFVLSLSRMRLRHVSEIRVALERALAARAVATHYQFLAAWSDIVESLDPGSSGQNAGIGNVVAELKQRAAQITLPVREDFSIETLAEIVERLRQPRKHLMTTQTMKTILLIVATDNEWAALSEVASANRQTMTPLVIPKLASWRLSVVNGYEIIVVRTEAGTQGAGTATLTTQAAIKEFAPVYVIMCGICFGLKKGKQKMSHVLVAKPTIDYETCKIKNGKIIERGPSYEPSTELVSKVRLMSAARKNVHVGPIVCGCKLINDRKFRDELVQRFPEAIGGEMEGVGVASACHRNNVEWILLKGICDWALRKDDRFQIRAAKAALAFCFQIVKHLPPG